MTYHIIKIGDISFDGDNLIASCGKEEWLRRVFKDALPEYVRSFEGTFSAQIAKMERSIDIAGGVYLSLNVECARCVKDITVEQQIPFRFLLEPAPKDGLPEGEEEDVSEALDFSYYSGDEIDLGELVRQHIATFQPMSYLCDEECKGLCPTCGHDLNEGLCKCIPEHGDSPFSVLKGLKTRKP